MNVAAVHVQGAGDAQPRRHDPWDRHSPAPHYPSHTRALAILAQPLLADGGPARYLPAEIWRDDELPPRPGDHVPVTAGISDDHADRFLDTGARFTPWSGGQVGSGIAYQRVFTGHNPS